MQPFLFLTGDEEVIDKCGCGYRVAVVDGDGTRNFLPGGGKFFLERSGGG